jgi:SAM-dependent methyltransferase
MSAEANSSSREFFERMYVRDVDPWKFSSDPYESSRYDCLIDCLSGKHFARGYEPGCSVGVLTDRLAPFCKELLATDLSETAVDRARQRCVAHAHVRFMSRSVAEIDPGPLDLLVLSEIGYYFNASDLMKWASQLFSCMRPGGTILTCHWLGVSPDHLLSGNQVQDIFQKLATDRSYTSALTRCTENYRLESWTIEGASTQ